ncbi:alpha-2-macroglobulin-like [Mastacembelus armatus]|uniref:alpha-2-macroglobulin-like n=1 Tax=Mastacembelus armatus TaxID=205130 RepID=UPI000E45DB4E|nr:alpha-2-macroglobulin-like [Mastacembelus armatus]
MGGAVFLLRTWTLYVFLTWMCGDQVLAGPQYIVAVPAVLEAGAQARFCASLLQPSETLVMTVSLVSGQKSITLLKKTSSRAFHDCTQFKVPLVKKQEVQTFEVEVRGKTFSSKEVRKVMIQVYQPMTFVQTDKPLYLPGQTVHLRVVTLDTKLVPVSRRYDIIEIEDASGNRIGQWLNETSTRKIVQLSYTLSSEAREGIYQIIVTIGEDKVYHSFKVEKYVLPRFEVKLDTADEVSVAQEQLQVKVCAMYTFGQPVPGSVKVEMCRPSQPYFANIRLAKPAFPPGVPDVTPPCSKETKQLDKKGCATFTFMMSTFTKVDQSVLQDILEVKATVEEEGTGVVLTQRKTLMISYIVGRLSFFDTPTVYEQGQSVTGKVKAVHYNGTAIPFMQVHLFEGEVWSARRLLSFTTDSSGVATFSISTADNAGDIHLQVSDRSTLGYPGYRVPYYETGEHRLSMVQQLSPAGKSVSSLQVKSKDKPLSCGKEEEIFIQYTIVGEAQGSVDVMFLVLSRGAIVLLRRQQIAVMTTGCWFIVPVTQGQVSFKLNVSPEMVPLVQVVAYAVLPSETVIASSADFSTEKCFTHKVSLEFTPSSAVPGEQVTMTLTAEPHSLCGVSAVDRSVFIKEPGKSLDADKIFSLLPVVTGSYIPYEVQDSTECFNVRAKRSRFFPYPGPDASDDAFTVFQNVGLKMVTNLLIQIPSCLRFKGREYQQGAVTYRLFTSVIRHCTPVIHFLLYSDSFSGLDIMDFKKDSGLSPASPVVTVRTFFPETWIWELVDVGVCGIVDIPLTVPDTITTWETEVFCLSLVGFGLAPRTTLTVFQPFFLELTLPYSVIRGERFELKATTFSYLTSCIMVTVTPAPSLDYTLTPLSGGQYTFCLCGSERKTVSWTMTPSTLGTVTVSVTAGAVASQASCGNEIVSVPERGRIDVVTKSLIVKAEGIKVIKTYNWLLCPKGETLTEELQIQLPTDVIPGSVRVLVSVLGDILGRALKNLDGLLKMPSGCGEQNAAALASDIYILEYLTVTQQLTQAIKEKATTFLISGYQRQLNYKHADGAYSAFLTVAGNTWLTAFVVRCFTKAQSFIYIDPQKIEESKTWLLQQQRQTGCFVMSGELFHNDMKGGVSDEVTLSAYITAVFLEMKMPVSDPVMNKSLSCLKQSVSNLNNTYTTALLAYVFTLAGDMETRAQLLQHLDTVAIRQGGFLYWSQTSTETSASLSVEISSYVLLAKLSASPTDEDLGYASFIVRWLTSQQNHYGGFSSTQDTVVALQILHPHSLSGGQYTFCLCGSERKTALDHDPINLGTVTVSVTAGAVASQASCGMRLLGYKGDKDLQLAALSKSVKTWWSNKVKAVHYNGTAIPFMQVHLFEGEVWSARRLLSFTTDSSGVATFSISTADNAGDIHLQVSDTSTLGYPGYRVPYYETGEHRLSMVQQLSPAGKSVSSLQVKSKDKPLSCGKEEEIFIQYTIVGEAQGSVDVMFLVLSRGAIVLLRRQQIAVMTTGCWFIVPVTQGQVSFKLNVSPEMVPLVQVVAYAVLPSETVIASSADFSTEKCFTHKVSLEFTPSSAVPGEQVTMTLTAEPHSLCGVSAVDRSVFIKEPGKSLDADKIFSLLPVVTGSYIPYEVQDSTECFNVRAKRSRFFPYPGPDASDDAFTVFQNVGLKMVTNLLIQIPSCLRFKGREYQQGAVTYRLFTSVIRHCTPVIHFLLYSDSFSGLDIMDFKKDSGLSPASPVVTVRTFFPETWIWELVDVGVCGIVDIPLTVPDTITTWETEVFCLSLVGFGLAPRTTLTVFQPFFLELTLPYSVIRGERFELKATTFSYLTSCIMVTVTPAPSLDYTLTPLSGGQYTFCLCGSERKTVSWTMTPSTLGTVTVSVTAGAVASQASCGNEIVSVPERGRIDVVTKSLIVKAEGIKVIKTYNWLLCPKGETLTEELQIQLPTDVIPGSVRVLVSVLGDILGRALKNLDGLLQMPSGCGEQNAAPLACDIYILEYLTVTQQLTQAIKEKATTFLITGYQTQLNYKHADGAYSAFLTVAGNTWLTAFVVRCFTKAQSFIYIDPQKIEESKTWLLQQQRQTGCFVMSGELFHNDMKGGVSDEVTLSAYITAVFLEMKMPVSDPVMNKSLSCLKQSVSNLNNTYTTALLAYVFTLAGDMETRAQLLQHLDTVAIRQGGFLYWSQTSTETSASLSVEISSYVLLAKLSASPSNEDLSYASLIVRWLTGQLNYYGGFSSTQNTVVALQALSLYATLVFSAEGSSTVTVWSPSGQLTFYVSKTNKLVYQEKMLPDVTGKCKLEVKGTTCVLVQISLHYNIPTPTNATTLSVVVTTEVNCTKSPRPKLTLKLRSLYSGKRTRTNMVILDIKMLSGFVPDPESLKRLNIVSSQLKGALLVARVEQIEDHVVVYLTELTKNVPVDHQLELIQELSVEKLKPAVVKIYDYYKPSDRAETEYSFRCAAGNSPQ